MSFYVQKVLDSKMDVNHLFTGKLVLNRVKELLHWFYFPFRVLSVTVGSLAGALLLVYL